jgi:formylglycine-generating enzyme
MNYRMNVQSCGILLLLFNTLALTAQETRFFRLLSPGPTALTAYTPDGYVTWTNAAAGVICTVQTATVLALEGWVDYVQVLILDRTTTHRLFDPNPPPGMAFIPAGSFEMGDSFSEGSLSERPVHTVNVSAFYMDRYEVTKALWDEVYSWAIAHGYSFQSFEGEFEYGEQGKAANHPVHTMTWYDAVKWCNARSEREGKVPAYYTDAGIQPYRTGEVLPYVNWSTGYRLPTEAEWEKAARGGASGHRFPWSDSDTITHSWANYYSSTSYSFDTSPTSGYHPTFNDGVDPYTSPVGFFAPNGYGLYDMAGNVFEWCWDLYGPYSSAMQTDPRGPAIGSNRVARGGSWYDDACRSAHRAGSNPGGRGYDIGFRAVLPAGQ